MLKKSEKFGRLRRRRRIRKKISGDNERPRLNIYRSQNGLYLQLIDDIEGKTLFAFSTLSEAFRDKKISSSNIAGAQALGELAAQEAQNKGFKKVVFDRSGYAYHGRVKACCEAARKAGLEF